MRAVEAAGTVIMGSARALSQEGHDVGTETAYAVDRPWVEHGSLEFGGVAGRKGRGGRCRPVVLLGPVTNGRAGDVVLITHLRQFDVTDAVLAPSPIIGVAQTRS
ncbi:MAG: hypothetical protein C0467_29665 [Planctomycetaceae bacterium]|nr:hypothetical protein [Planctomycetaceae bacterium]